MHIVQYNFFKASMQSYVIKPTKNEANLVILNSVARLNRRRNVNQNVVQSNFFGGSLFKGISLLMWPKKSSECGHFQQCCNTKQSKENTPNCSSGQLYGNAHENFRHGRRVGKPQDHHKWGTGQCNPCKATILFMCSAQGTVTDKPF